MQMVSSYELHNIQPLFASASLNTLHLSYNKNNRCCIRNSYKSHKYTMWPECSTFTFKRLMCCYWTPRLSLQLSTLWMAHRHVWQTHTLTVNPCSLSDGRNCFSPTISSYLYDILADSLWRYSSRMCYTAHWDSKTLWHCNCLRARSCWKVDGHPMVNGLRRVTLMGLAGCVWCPDRLLEIVNIQNSRHCSHSDVRYLSSN